MHECVLPSGLCLRYREKGRGPAVLMLHGWTGGSWFYDSLLEHLSDRFRIVAPDFKGHGESDKPLASAYTLDALVDETFEFINALSLKDPVIIGHSMGGMIALLLFLKHNADLHVRGLMLLCTSPGNPRPSPQLVRIIKGMHRNIEKYGTHVPPALARKLALAGYDPEFAAAHPEKINFALREAEKVPARPRIDLFEDMSCNYCVLPDLPRIDVPCLCISGTRDSMLSATRIIAETVPRAQLITYENAGHMISWERESEVNKAISEFLTEIYTRD